MIYFCFRNYCISFLYVLNIIIIVQRVLGNSLIPNVSQELISKLYSKYKEAVEDDTPISTRRLFTQNRQYKIHVKKLKQVNGFKRHNLLIKEVKTEKNPFIYINNPVESKIPNAYLTLEEFKQALTNRILTQREIINKEIKLHLRTPKEFKTTKLISSQYSKMITIVSNNSKEVLTTKPKNYTLSKLPNNINLTDVTETNLKITNSTITLITKIIPNITTTIKIMSETFKDEEILTKEPFQNYTDEITEPVTRQKENIVSTITQLKENTENFTNQDLPTIDTIDEISDITTLTNNINIDILKKVETESLKNQTEVTTKATSDETDSPTITFPSSFYTEELTRKQLSNEELVTEDNMETEKIEDAETSTEIITESTTITTRSTRRTLGRPLVFMGGN